ncbi:PREDICTED: 7SK snRNA methylphosphate capping enzyme-like [Cyprinodon variegatus]|uniref:RNA methyltransferase n=1 Tax=Cyprinodon variegatus TaxID=28743 RepID=A0A3Q2DKU6_CYPVA|nr:PREDICTED: 7SK snRNA methylphosphate capping enzyme-like [Cyprinodon variegatus]
MSVEADSVLPPELPVKLSPTFPPPASLSEHPQLAKPRPPIHPKNGHQPHLPPPPPPPPANQRGGKRRFSVGLGFKGVAKRRRRFNSDSQAEPVLPSHFLLGGNIFDPLNLNSLLDEEVNRATNQETPRSSPLPSRSRDAVQILVPRDITDPLNLNAGEGDGVLVSPLKSRRRHRYRQHGGGGEKEAVAARLFPPSAVPSVPASPLSCELNTAITCRDDVAPPPILPRRHTHPPSGPTHKPGNHGRRRRTTSIRSAEGAVAMETSAPPTEFQTPLVGGAKAGRSGGPLPGSAPTPQKKKDKLRYQYGNHCRYYGYQASYSDGHDGRVGAEEDPRLRLLEADWFREKTVLDVGCGAGHMTLAISRKFGPAHILGVELDGRLVHAARQNIRHFLSHDLVVEGRGEQPMEAPPPLPLSFRVSRGPLSAPPLLPSSSSSSGFPGNITFIQGDYVAEKEAWPGRGKYDVILCLGVTKWVQLQWGDRGVARLFRRAYQSLSPGGLLILEPQPWSSYIRSKRASETTLRNFRTLRIRPEHFTSFLTDSVGFSSYRLLTHTGDHRPIYLFHKGSTHRK